MSPRLKTTGTFAALLLLSLSAQAEPPQSRGNGTPPSPPAEAYAACAGKTEGAKVSITTPRGDTLSASCQLIGDRLAARPDGPPGAARPQN